MKTFVSLLTGLFYYILSAASAFAHGPHSATYMGNAAVLVTLGETKILFDPLFHDGFGTYQLVSDETRARIMAGTAPYDGVDAIFISHAHGDHFDAVDVNRYLAAHPSVKLVAPAQAVDTMRYAKGWQEDFDRRVHSLDMDYGESPKTITIGSIKATAVRIPHAGWPAPRRVKVQNMVYRVDLGADAVVMHMGDADVNPEHYVPFEGHWQAVQTDTAFPPYWFFTFPGGTDILYDQMNVKAAIGVHVPIRVPTDLKASGSDYFSKPGEVRERD